MRPAPEVGAAPVTVLLDVRHPLAYLALAPAAALADELGIDFDWLPLVAQPLNAPSEPAPGDDRGILHRRHRARAIAREISTYAAAQGLVLRDYYRDGDPSAVNLGWLFARERHPDRLLPFLTEAFRAYWAQELDASSEPQVAKILDELGADGEAYRAWCADEGGAAAAAVAAALRDRGLASVPCYLVGDEVFVGRQHLPMIRWVLGGCAGPGPV